MTSERRKDIALSEFNYELPHERIAQKPLEQRALSRLLVYRNGNISHKRFDDIVAELPEDTLLVFNNTRVIPARIFVYKETGARIQVFLLNPVSPYTEVERALEVSSGKTVWKCMIGNAKRWKEGETLKVIVGENTLALTLESKEDGHVGFQWDGDIPFCDLIEAIGKMPLPPYIRREAEVEDESRYQTVFAKNNGAVAAPTAGLHFTDEVIESLKQKGVVTTELTLHVGAGTFKPVEVDNVWDHTMHEEYFQVSMDTINDLLERQTRIATGTTSLRTLESLYWVGVKLLNNLPDPWVIDQLYPYEYNGVDYTYEEALEAIRKNGETNGNSQFFGKSGIMIVPGYRIRSIKGLITNFHLPKSTLLMLISALVGDNWKEIYKEALSHDYRFLSYGDSSLLMV